MKLLVINTEFDPVKRVHIAYDVRYRKKKNKQ